MNKVIAGFLLVFAFNLGADPAGAQMCFRGKPAPECSTFWITETGLGYMVSHGGRFWPNAETGLMFNVGKRYAVGSTAYIAFDDRYNDFRGGIKLRLRRWLNRDLSVNLSGGLLLFGGSYDEQHPGFTGHVDLNYKDYVAPYLGLNAISGGSLDGVNWHLGARFGSYPGLVGIGIGFVIGAIAYVTWAVGG